MRLIACSAVGNVAACPACGHVHLTLEYLTLRLEPAAFRDLASMLVDAQAILDGHREPGGAGADAASGELEAPADIPLH